MRRARPTRHARRPARAGVLHGLALTATAVLAFGGAAAATAYVQLQDNITSADVSDLLAPVPTDEAAAPADPDDPNAGQDLNILVMGSDDRSGENEQVSGYYVDGMRSDTTIVVHVSADRSRVELVSIPRDSMVQIPACTMTNGVTTRAQRGMFNSAFALGADTGGDVLSAAACTINTVQQNTGLTIDDWVVVDMAGFVRMVDALGGVTMCIPEDISSEKANNLTLTAGVQTLPGTIALDFARARTGEGLGDGSDTSRIGRQQQLIAATLNQVLSKNMLTDVGQLISFFDAATESLTIDEGLSSLTDLTGLAFSLREIGAEDITLLTIPWAPDPADPNRVVWTDEADAVWARLVADQPAVVEPAPEAPADPQSPGATDAPATDPATDPGTGTDPGTDPAAPTPTETKEAGREAFTGADVTAVCA